MNELNNSDHVYCMTQNFLGPATLDQFRKEEQFGLKYPLMGTIFDFKHDK